MAWDNPDPGVGSIPLIVQVIHTPYLFKTESTYIYYFVCLLIWMKNKLILTQSKFAFNPFSLQLNDIMQGQK